MTLFGSPPDRKGPEEELYEIGLRATPLEPLKFETGFLPRFAMGSLELVQVAAAWWIRTARDPWSGFQLPEVLRKLKVTRDPTFGFYAATIEGTLQLAYQLITGRANTPVLELIQIQETVPTPPSMNQEAL